MAQLNRFDGGINLRLSSQLIPLNTGVIFNNINNDGQSLRPMKQDLYFNQVVEKSLYYFKGIWVNDTSARDYVEFQEKLYFSNGVTRPQKSTNGTQWYNLGISGNTVAPIVTQSGAGVLDPASKVQYCYTYYNVNDGTESQPTPFSPEVTVGTTLTNIGLIASTDPQVTNIRLYRLGGTLTSMKMVHQYTNTTTTVTDTYTDLLIDGTPLTSQLNGIAPMALTNLTQTNAMFFGSIGSTLYFSDIAFVNNWSPFNFIEFDGVITGISAVQSGLLVFTSNKTYIINGTGPSSLSKYLLDGSQGCKAHKSIQFVNGSILWVSNDGICISSGSSVKVLTMDKLGKVNYTPVCSAILDEEYYLFTDTGTVIIDTRFNQFAIKNTDIICQGAHYSSILDDLYYSRNSRLYRAFGESLYREYHYKSGRIADGAISNQKNYKTFYAYSIGEAVLSIYIDGTLATTETINGYKEIEVPQDLRRGYYIELEMTGSGELLEIEYKAEGRKNGR